MTQKENKPEKLKIKINFDMMEQQKIGLYVLMDQVECFIIAQAIEKYQDNHTRAAEALGINRTTFVMKLRKLRGFGIDPKGDLKDKLNHLF